jgi:hypothetical protein
MFKTPVSRRIRAILIALCVTFAANFAISVAANASTPQAIGPDGSGSTIRSGNQTTPAPPIKPRASRSGIQIIPPPPPKL